MGEVWIYAPKFYLLPIVCYLGDSPKKRNQKSLLMLLNELPVFQLDFADTSDLF